MPRLLTSLILKAYNKSPLLTLLLRPCRDLPSARNELRWLREHAIAHARTQTKPTGWRTFLRRLCEERGRGKPLQYILGNQPFGDVDILCRSGVLIPRPETESYTTHLANLILSRRRQCSTWPRCGNSAAAGPLRILDLCTGTGCIPILLYSLLSQYIRDLQIFGVDISNEAIALARKNLRHNIANGNVPPMAKAQVRFLRADVLERTPTPDLAEAQAGLDPEAYPETESKAHGYPKPLRDVLTHLQCQEWDILTSNPPYISPRSYNTCTARSVRNFEPKLALVPPQSQPQPHPPVRSQSRSQSPASISTCTSPINTDPHTHPEQNQEGNDKDGDAFYPTLLSHASILNAKIVILEVADMQQARRVCSLALASNSATDSAPDSKSQVDESRKTNTWEAVEIWRDWLGNESSSLSFPEPESESAMEEGAEEGDEEEEEEIGIRQKPDVAVPNTGTVSVHGGRGPVRVRIRGEGNARVVVCYTF